MTNIRALANQHIGRPVIVHSSYGVHRGILHHCDNNGMYLQLNPNGRYGVASGDSSPAIETLNDASSSDLDAQQVFWPFFFIPFAAAFALSPWWGPYWW